MIFFIKNHVVEIILPEWDYSLKKRKPAQGRLGRQGGGS
ncbi:Hypothetical protein ETEE_3005 [Edwardsiella anguillarum ET080813]|uniref:Uncharacterized protein n=1 Tax=Edwardsiella anguillarum ET080813 TaxID=667120 RepID=A0A076LV57_9GAMM|nr:Hypothetical protein ETEE_3005 [Edwardsiella anguillarum ET080813]